MKTTPPLITVTAVALVLGFGIECRATPGAEVTPTTDWPQWRGPDRDGLSAGPAWPDKLDSDSLVQQWRVELGPSYSGPIVVGNRVFTTQTSNQEREVVHAFDLESGEELWQHSWLGVMRVPFFAKKNGSWIRSTPAADDKYLFVAGMRDVLACIDQRSGKECWRIDFPKDLDTALPNFGFVCSPLIDGDDVIVQAGGSTIRMKKSDGSIVWRSLKDDGGMSGSAFSSPIIADVAGRRQLLVQTRAELCGLDPTMGTVFWKQTVPAYRGMNILTPVVHQDTLFTSTYGGKAFGYSLKNDGSKLEPETRFELKLQGYMSTPVIIDGHAYLHLRNKRFACVDLKTGEKKWETDERFGQYWSLIARGDKLLALDERGILYLIKADPEKFTPLGEFQVSEAPTWAHLAISGNRLIVRELKALTVFQWKP